MAESPNETGESPEIRAYRRGFRQKNKRDDYALDLFQQARANLASDPRAVARILRELSRLYNPIVNGPIVDAKSFTRIMELLEAGSVREAQVLLDERHRLYAPLDDEERRGPDA